MATQSLLKACIVQREAHSTHPHFQMVSVTLSQSGISIEKTLAQVLSGPERNAFTLMPSTTCHRLITHSYLHRFPSSSFLLVNINSRIIYYLRAAKLMNILEKAASPQQFGANY